MVDALGDYMGGSWVLQPCCPVYHVYLMSDMLEHSILQQPHQITGHKLCLQILSIATWPWPGLGKRKSPVPTPHVLKVSPEISLRSEKGQGAAMTMHMWVA